MPSLDESVALVTGGGSGIGRSVVERFVEEGAKVAVLEISDDGVEALRADFGDDVVAVQGDVTNAADNERAVDRAVEAFGQLDVFVGNAGIFDNFARLQDIPSGDLEAGFHEQFDVNVLGYLLGARAAVPELSKTEGTIVFTASYASFNADGGGLLYTASKHAVVGIVRRLAVELAPEIRVNGVAPGFVPTNLQGLDSLGQGGSPSPRKPYADINPLATTPTSDDYAGYYAFLASDESSPSTGTIIEADCGCGL